MAGDGVRRRGALLSAIGVCGVLAYLVVQRTKEIGVRIALGSSGTAVFRSCSEGAHTRWSRAPRWRGGVLALKRSLDSLLFGVSAVDPTVLVAVTMMLAIVAITAGAFPAHRAARINPTVALAE